MCLSISYHTKRYISVPRDSLYHSDSCEIPKKHVQRFSTQHSTKSIIVDSKAAASTIL